MSGVARNSYTMAKGGDGTNGKSKGDKGDKGDEITPNRSRWATRKLTIKSGGTKRVSIIDRIHKRTTSTEKKRQSGTSQGSRLESVNEPDEDVDRDDAHSSASSDDGEGRILFFNQPLPDEFKDETGLPKQTYTRNKIRTAKYTPLSFIPKNLWFQFHNIANIFFLFLVILVVSPSSAFLLIGLCYNNAAST